MKTIRSIVKLPIEQKLILVFMFVTWVIVVALRANLAHTFSPWWYVGIALGWYLTAQLAWRARGYVEAQRKGHAS